MKDFWNARYAEAGYAYGKTANDFLQSYTFRKPSKILCLAEGEGRNAVYLAQRGHEVTAIDFSEVALEKTRQLAHENGVSVQTICADLNDYALEANHWDAIVSIFAHFPPEIRKKVHQQIFESLKPRGVFLLEAYQKSQLQRGTGGPNALNMLYAAEEIRADFQAFSNIQIESKSRQINEGAFHNGISDVIQLIARK